MINQASQHDEKLKEAAQRLGAALSLGRGKTERIMADLVEKLGTPCPYCKARLSLANCVYDHRTAIGSVSKRKSTGEKKQAIDSWDNLQLICKPCNQVKSDLNHDEFIGLLEYFAKFPAAKKKMLVRFRKERMSYRRRY